MGNPLVLRATNGRLPLSGLLATGAKGDPGNDSNKVDIDPLTGKAALSQMPFTQTGEGGLGAQYTPEGYLPVAFTAARGFAAETGWVADQLAAITGDASMLAKVNTPRYAPGSPLSLGTDAAAYTAVPTIVQPDGNTGEEWECSGTIWFRGPGIQIRHKTNGTATTNVATDPTFASGSVGGWTASGASLAIVTTDGRSDSSCLEMTATATSGGMQAFSDWHPFEQGADAALAGYLKRVTATSRTVRVDVQFGNASGTVIASTTGSNNTPGTDWATRGIVDSAHLGSGGSGTAVAPTGTTQYRFRWTVVSPTIGDKFRLDDYQIERGLTVPAFGSTGGSGSALTRDGDFSGLIVSSPTADDYRRSVSIRYPDVSTLGGSFGGLGASTDAWVKFSTHVTIGGTSLTNQRIELEAAPVAGGVASSIVRAVATFARVVVPG